MLADSGGESEPASESQGAHEAAIVEIIALSHGGFVPP
jgi:hypothetical protein